MRLTLNMAKQPIWRVLRGEELVAYLAQSVLSFLNPIPKSNRELFLLLTCHR